MIGRGLAMLGAMLLGVGACWSVGFTRFSQQARTVAPPPPDADAIVALTGGADRIDTALHLLANKRAPLLLVSGVGRGADLPELLRRAGEEAEPVSRQVTLGRVATTTAGNAAETAAWAQANRVRRLIVVTAGYHMPRALWEIGRVLPDVALYPVPVLPPAMRGPADPAAVRILANEYDKLLAVRYGWAWIRPGDGL